VRHPLKTGPLEADEARMRMRWGTMHRLAFAIVAPFGAAALVAWALYGLEGAETVGWCAVLATYLAVTGVRTRRQMRDLGHWFGWRAKVKPEDREERRLARERRRRARQAAFERYGTVVPPDRDLL
jgi:hypothetical protein